MTRFKGIAAVTVALSLLVFAAFWLPTGWPLAAPTSSPSVAQIDTGGAPLFQTDEAVAAVSPTDGQEAGIASAIASPDQIADAAARVAVNGTAHNAGEAATAPDPTVDVADASAATTGTSPSSSATTGSGTTTAVPAAPVTDGLRLRIPALGVDALVIELGFNAQGQLEVPSDAYTVGWYSISSAPGELGNALFGAHLNWRGSLGVFGKLDQLHDGDLIYVVRDGQELAYAVSRTGYVAADAPLSTVLQAPAPGSTLTLFTCGGTFDRSVHEYDHRFVVSAVRLANGAG